jgi:uncharacterized protein with HEPN domain
MPHDPKVLLEDVRLAVHDIQEFTRGRSLSDYQGDRLLRAGVERLFIIIGEALTRLDKLDANLAARITDHRKIIGFRNVLVHGYEVIDDQVVWQAIQAHLPILRQEVECLLAGLGAD